jgi:hypothetical protein
MIITHQNSCAQKKTKIISACAVISRISEKPFNYSNGHFPGVKPMFEYQVEKNIFGGYFYTYGIGFKGLGERRNKVLEDFKTHDVKVTNLGETLSDGWRIDTVFTYVGDLTNKHRIKMGYVYFPAGITYYAGEKLSFGTEYCLAYVWSGKYSLDVLFSDVDNIYKYNYSVDVGLPGNKKTKDKYLHRWDHWIRFSAKYIYKDYLFRFGFEKGLTNIFTGKDLPGTSNGNTIYLRSRDFFWQNTSIFLGVGVKLPN